MDAREERKEKEVQTIGSVHHNPLLQGLSLSLRFCSDQSEPQICLWFTTLPSAAQTTLPISLSRLRSHR